MESILLAGQSVFRFVRNSVFIPHWLMETKSVYPHELSGVLKQIKRTKMPIKIYNRSGQWLDHFFGVLEIKEINSKNYQVQC